MSRSSFYRKGRADLIDALAQVAVSRAAEAHVMPADVAFAELLVILAGLIAWGVRRGARR